VPTLMEALAGKKVIGAAAGLVHTVVWTDEEELTFGRRWGASPRSGGPTVSKKVSLNIDAKMKVITHCRPKTAHEV